MGRKKKKVNNDWKTRLQLARVESKHKSTAQSFLEIDSQDINSAGNLDLCDQVMAVPGEPVKQLKGDVVANKIEQERMLVKARQARFRSRETSEQKKERLEKNKCTTKEARIRETPDQKKERLENNKCASKEARLSEIPDQKNQRLDKMKRASKEALLKETPEQKKLRLEKMKMVSREAVRNETPEQKNERLVKKREASCNARYMETTQQTAQRQTDDKERTSRSRKMKSMRSSKRSSRLAGAELRRRDDTSAVKRRRLDESIVDGDYFFDPAMMDAEFLTDVANIFHANLYQMESELCSICCERFPDIKLSNGNCQRCKRLQAGDGKKAKKFAKENDMDPGEQPKELQGLSPTEEIIISRVVPLMQVYNRPLGQYAYSGNVINLPQDVTSIATRLPRLSSDLSIVVLRKEGEAGLFKDFRVRRHRVQQALEYLSKRNEFFKDIIIDQDHLDRLPEDGELDIPDHLVVDPAEKDSDGSSLSSSDYSDDGDEPVRTFLPVLRQPFTEKVLKEGEVDDVLNEGSNENPLSWPSLNTEQPIDEFNTPGYVSMAFPTLFPYGKADPHTSRRSAVPDVSQIQFYQHIIRYKDGRFARHNRFRYFALNTILRHRAMKAGRVFVRNNIDEAQLSVEELVNMANKDKEALLKKITRYCEPLSGSKEYWSARRQELLHLIKFKEKLPTIFFTLSSADYQWPDLHRLLPGYDGRRATAVQENPLICVWLFTERVKNIIEHSKSYAGVMKKKFRMADLWGRYEFQHRGSIHFHAVGWLEGAPDVTKIPDMDAEELDVVVKYFDQLLTTMHPGLDALGSGDIPEIPVNPASVPYFQVKDKHLDYLGLVVWCQTHRCRVGYCKKADDDDCRFGFPKALEEKSRINIELNEKTGTKVVTFVGRRNHAYINSHNRDIAMVHRANTDMQAITEKQRCVGYLTKYVSKVEPQSNAMRHLTGHALATVYPDDPVRQLAQRVLMQSVGDRDYTAQETMHILMSYPQFTCSRTFIPMFLRGTRELTQHDGEPVLVSNIVDKCCKRPQQYRRMSMMQFYTEFSFGSGEKVSKRAQKAVVVPRGLKKVPRESPHFDEYAKHYLMVHKPFKDVADILGGKPTFTDAMDNFLLTFDENAEFDLTDDVANYEGNGGEDKADHESAEDERLRRRGLPAEFSDLLKVCPKFSASVTSGCDFNWNAAYAENQQQYDNVKEYLTTENGNQEKIPGPAVDPSRLNTKQSSVYNTVADHQIYGEEPLLVIVTGRAGTGKSFLILCLQQLLGDKLLIMAPTGVAACNVSGQTVHSALRLRVGPVSKFADLKGPALEALQENLHNVEYVILEEMSMVGATRLGMIDSRLRQAFPSQSGVVFGGRSFLMIGDFGQLPPVCDRVMYVKHESKNKLQCAGALAYRAFRRCTNLNVVVRQEGDHRFRDILHRVRNGTVTVEDCQVLKTREKTSLRKYPGFEDATELFTTRNEVGERNAKKLGELAKPIAYFEAEHKGGAKVKTVDSDDAGGLEPRVMLSEGAKVMLTSNLNIGAGLYNGTVGTVEKIVYSAGKLPPSLPTVILCRFPTYRGKNPFIPGEPTLFPIVPITRHFPSFGIDCSRTMIPLRLAWALTVHKTQGLTLEKEIVDLGEREFSSGLTFVALSRVRRLSDLLLAPFNIHRILNLGGKKTESKRATGRRESKKNCERRTPLQRLQDEDNRLQRMEANPGQLLSNLDNSCGSSTVPSDTSSSMLNNSNVSPTKLVTESTEFQVASPIANVPAVSPTGLPSLPRTFIIQSDASESVQLPNPITVSLTAECGGPDPEYMWFKSISTEERKEICDKENWSTAEAFNSLRYGPLKIMNAYSDPTVIIKVPGQSSHSFYHAISCALFGHPNYHGELRDRCVLYMENHYGEMGLTGEERDTLVNKIVNNYWAGAIEIKAMAGYLKMDILAYDVLSGEQRYRWTRHCSPDHHSDNALYIFHSTRMGRKQLIRINRSGRVVKPDSFVAVLDVQQADLPG